MKAKPEFPQTLDSIAELVTNILTEDCLRSFRELAMLYECRDFPVPHIYCWQNSIVDLGGEGKRLFRFFFYRWF